MNSTISERVVSAFSNVTQVKGSNRSLSSVLNAIRSGYPQITEYHKVLSDSIDPNGQRRIDGASDEEIKRLKQNLPSITPAVRLLNDNKSRATQRIESYTGLIYIDIDAADNPQLKDLEYIEHIKREILEEVESTYLVCKSSSGSGLSILLYAGSISSEDEYLAAWRTGCKILKSKIDQGLEIDEKVKNSTRLWFVPFDKFLQVEESPTPFEWSLPKSYVSAKPSLRSDNRIGDKFMPSTTIDGVSYPWAYNYLTELERGTFRATIKAEDFKPEIPRTEKKNIRLSQPIAVPHRPTYYGYLADSVNGKKMVRDGKRHNVFFSKLVDCLTFNRGIDAEGLKKLAFSLAGGLEKTGNWSSEEYIINQAESIHRGFLEGKYKPLYIYEKGAAYGIKKRYQFLSKDIQRMSVQERTRIQIGEWHEVQADVFKKAIFELIELYDSLPYSYIKKLSVQTLVTDINGEATFSERTIRNYLTKHNDLRTRFEEVESKGAFKKSSKAQDFLKWLDSVTQGAPIELDNRRTAAHYKRVLNSLRIQNVDLEDFTRLKDAV